MPTITIRRNHEFSNACKNSEILVDGEVIGAVSNGSTASFRIQSGAHSIQAHMGEIKSNEVHIVLMENETALLQLRGNASRAAGLLLTAVASTLLSLLLMWIFKIGIFLFVAIPLAIAPAYLRSRKGKALSLKLVSPQNHTTF